MRARSYHASPGEITSVGGCAQDSSMWTGKTRRIDPILQVMTGWPRPARSRPRPAAGRRRPRPLGLLRAVPPRARGLTGKVGRLMLRAHDVGKVGRALEAWGSSR